MARHRSPSGPLHEVRHLTSTTVSRTGRRHGTHRSSAPSGKVSAWPSKLAALASSVPGWARLPSLVRLRVVGAAVIAVAAILLVASQPISLNGAAEARAETGPAEVAAAAAAERAASASDSARDDRGTGAVPLELPAPPATEPAEDGVLLPELDEASAGGRSGSAAEGAVNCPTSGFNGVRPHVAQAGYHLMGVFDIDESDVIGVAARPNNPTSDHPRGLALDFIVDNSTGDDLAAYADENTEALGISYILWQVPDHYDHVHISFNEEPGPGLPC